MTYKEGYGTLKISEPTGLRDIALTMSYIPNDFKTPALEEIRKLLKEYDASPHPRVECAWSTFVTKKEEYRKPDSGRLKSILTLNLGDAGWDYSTTNPELSLRLKKLHDDLDKEKWDFESLNKQLMKWRYKDWKEKYAWDLENGEMKQVDHPFKGLILGNPIVSNPHSTKAEVLEIGECPRCATPIIVKKGTLDILCQCGARIDLRAYWQRQLSKKNGNPNSISLPLHQKLVHLRSIAMQRLQIKEYRRKITPEEYSILRSLSWKLPPAFQNQIWRDIKTYNFYDALAMWLDPEYGLASYYPSEFVAIGEHFLGKVELEPKPEPKEIGVSGHIANYDVFISGDNVIIIEDRVGGKSYKRVVKGLGDFVKKAGKDLRIGWAKFPDFEVVYIYNKADQNFGYAVNLQIPEFSEWGYAPFSIESKPELKSAEEVKKAEAERHKRDIKEISKRIEHPPKGFVLVHDMKELARFSTEAQARDLFFKLQKEKGWYPPALTIFTVEMWEAMKTRSLEAWKKVPMEQRPHIDTLKKLVLDNLKEHGIESTQVEDRTQPSGYRLVVTKRGRAYSELKKWWQETTIYPLEWLDAAINSLIAERKVKRYINLYGIDVIEVVEESGVSVRHGIEISGIPEKPVAKPLREVRAEELSQTSFEKLIYGHLEKAKKDLDLQRKLKLRFEQICDKANWKRAIPTMKFTYYLDALDIAAAISWYHGGVDFRVISPSEIQVWSKGYYYYTGGA